MKGSEYKIRLSTVIMGIVIALMQYHLILANNKGTKINVALIVTFGFLIFHFVDLLFSFTSIVLITHLNKTV